MGHDSTKLYVADDALPWDRAQALGYDIKVASPALRHHLIVKVGHVIEHVYKGTVVATIACTVKTWGNEDERFIFKGLTGQHSLLVSATDADRLDAHWRVFAAECRARHDRDLAAGRALLKARGRA